ncbi:unnamed protein product [Peniophora sp. CBMAI 1063]|nr:unnamed protein product [Peniophora sp. CBMAI 1063]
MCRQTVHSSPLISLAIFVGLVYGQDFAIPTDWRKPNSTRSHSERLLIAQNAAQSLTPAVNVNDGTTPGMNPWASANVPAALAQCDYVSGSQSNRDFVNRTIQSFRSAYPPLFDQTQLLLEVTSDALMWGLAAFYGSRAYNDADLQRVAIDVWNVAENYAVSVQDAMSGTQHTRNTSFDTSCVLAGVNVAGAVFWLADIPNDYVSNGQTVGAHVALSAQLWESTGNITYLNAANLSATFMYSHMYSQTQHVMIDNYNLADCSNSASSNVWWTYNQGFFLEGISILSSAPIQGNTSWAQILQSFVTSTVNSPLWTESIGANAGILIENSTGDPEVFSEAFVRRNALFRALYEIWSRAGSSSAMANFIQAFVMVQYNALLDLASNNGSIYSPNWLGPTVTTAVPWGQLAAMEVLNAAIAMPPTNSSAPTGASATPSVTTTVSPSMSSSPSTSSIGEVVGIAVGATIGALSIVAVCAVWLIRRRRRANIHGARSDAQRDIDAFPPGLPVIQRPSEEPVSIIGAGYSSGKTRYRPGLALLSDSAVSTPLESVAPTGSSAVDPTDLAVPMLDGDQEAEIRRLVERLRNNINQFADTRPPPSYFSGGN